MIDREAELAAIEAHIAERGVTQCPPAGSDEMVAKMLRRLRLERIAARQPGKQPRNRNW